jgi:hypothetical protein
MFGANPIHHITEHHSIFSSMVVAGSCYGYAFNSSGLGSFSGYKNKLNGAKHRQNPRGNLVQSALYQTRGDEFTFQQECNLKHMAKSILELLTKKRVNVSESRVSFNLHYRSNVGVT